MTLARRVVTGIDGDGALLCTNVEGKQVNRVLKPRRAFIDLKARAKIAARQDGPSSN